MNYTIIKDSLLAGLRTTAMILLIFIGASLLGNAMSFLRIPNELAQLVASFNLHPMLLWFAIIVFYVILGCLMETMAMMLVTLPVIFPIVTEICGFNAVWFGIQLVILCEIGMITPPVGLNLFVIKGIAEDVEFKDIIRGVLGFTLILILCVVLFTFVPDIILFLPNIMLGE